MIMRELAPMRILVALPGTADAPRQFLCPLNRSHDTGLMDGNDAASSVHKALEHGQLLIRQVRKVQELNHQVSPVELLLCREPVGLIHSHPGNALEHGDKQFLDADVVMFTPAVILGTVEPEDANVPAQLGIFPLPRELHDLRLGNWFVWARGSPLSAISGDQQAD